jgi:hypothetical protein
VEPPPEAIAAALAAVSAVGLELAGVDLLPLQGGGWTVLEVNGAVDFTDDYSLAGRHVFDAAASSLLADGDGLVLPSGRAGARVAPTGV